jgi:uncharacterized membrane protein YbhN (UPF0104 family)
VKTRNIISLLLVALILTLGWWYLVRHRGDFYLITTLRPVPITLLFVLKIGALFFLGWQLWILTRAYGLDLTFPQAFGLSRLTTFAGLFLPFPGGASIKAVYLKKFHHFRYMSFVAAMSITAIIKMMMVSLVAVACLLPRGSEATVLLGLATVFLAASMGFLFLGHRIPDSWLSGWGRLRSLVDEWRTFRRNRRAVFEFTFASALGFLQTTLSIYVAFLAFSIPASLGLSAVIGAFINLLGTVKLVPGDLGTREFIFAAIAGVYGIGVNEGLHAAALFRIVETLCILALAPSSVFSLGRKEPAT